MWGDKEEEQEVIVTDERVVVVGKSAVEIKCLQQDGDRNNQGSYYFLGRESYQAPT